VQVLLSEALAGGRPNPGRSLPHGPGFGVAKVTSLDGVKSVTVEITFTPPWDPRIHASEDAKFDLGIWY